MVVSATMSDPETIGEHVVKTVVARLEARMTQKGLTAKALSIRAGLGATAVSDILRGKNGRPSLPQISAIANALNCDLAYLVGEQDYPTREPEMKGTFEVPISGIAEAGVFRVMPNVRSDFERELPSIAATRSIRYPRAKHFAMEVRGLSMNAAEPYPILPGMYALCVDMISAELIIETGKIYAVRRTLDAGSTYEFTIKRAFVFRDRIELRPESTDPSFQPLIIPRQNEWEDSGTEIMAIGLVYGAINSYEL